MKPVAIYLHIPFCARKCEYCDFASFVRDEACWAQYLLALEDEINRAARRYGRLRVSTVYFGGGTPSLLPGDAVMRLTAMLRAIFFLDEDAEITVEANPGTLTPEKLRDYRASGVNRLSLGAQAGQDALLQALGRIHRAADIGQAVAWARAAGFANLSLDLMYALPGQSTKDWVETLKMALALAPEHLSCYSLIVEPGTPLARAVAAGELIPPGEEESLQMQRAAVRILGRRGYQRYEISNYARPGFACRHNLVYWRRGDYLGLGCAAHSLMDGARFANTASLDDYLAGRREVERHVLDEGEIREEAIMLGTRTAEGIDAALAAPGAAQRLARLGLVEVRGGRLRLTEKGLDVHNAVVLELI